MPPVRKKRLPKKPPPRILQWERLTDDDIANIRGTAQNALPYDDIAIVAANCAPSTFRIWRNEGRRILTARDIASRYKHGEIDKTAALAELHGADLPEAYLTKPPPKDRRADIVEAIDRGRAECILTATNTVMNGIRQGDPKTALKLLARLRPAHFGDGMTPETTSSEQAAGRKLAEAIAELRRGDQHRTNKEE